LKPLVVALCLAACLGRAAEMPLDKALRERRQGRFEDSILTLQGLLKAEPKNTWAWYELGLSYATDAQYAKAIDAYRLALSYGFRDGQCRCALGLALRETRKPEAALAEARRCLAMLPGYAGAWNLVGNAEIDLGHEDKALEAYRKAVALDPTYANAHFNLGLTFGALHREAEAEAAFKRALALQPSMTEGWDAQGECQLRRKHARDAKKSFQQALRISPADAAAEWGLSRAFRALGDKASAARHAKINQRLRREADKREASLATPPRRPAGAAVEAWDKDARAGR
jgi:tetratricopeptide (TPR) repeat protein